MLTHNERVDLYVKILTDKNLALNEFNVAYMRAKAPTQHELDALNDALVKMGYEK